MFLLTLVERLRGSADFREQHMGSLAGMTTKDTLSLLREAADAVEKAESFGKWASTTANEWRERAATAEAEIERLRDYWQGAADLDEARRRIEVLEAATSGAYSVLSRNEMLCSSWPAEDYELVMTLLVGANGRELTSDEWADAHPTGPEPG